MLNFIWLTMLVTSVVIGTFTGRLDLVVNAVTEYAKIGFEVTLGLTGVMSLWLGIMKIATESGLINKIAKFLSPVMRILFPEVPADNPAMGAIILNISANMLGMANAATPFGIQAMRELQKLNQHAHSASNAMCTFLAINTSSVQLIPATAIAYLAANGATNPTSVIFSSLLATFCSTLVAIIAVKQLSKLPIFGIKSLGNL